MDDRLGEMIRRANLTQEEVGRALGVSQSAACRKLAGQRSMTQRDVTALLALLSKRLRRRVTYEQVFGNGARVA